MGYHQEKITLHTAEGSAEGDIQHAHIWARVDRIDVAFDDDTESSLALQLTDDTGLVFFDTGWDGNIPIPGAYFLARGSGPNGLADDGSTDQSADGMNHVVRFPIHVALSTDDDRDVTVKLVCFA